MTTILLRELEGNTLVRNGLPAAIGGLAAAATAGFALLPALGIGAVAGLGFTWLCSLRQA